MTSAYNHLRGTHTKYELSQLRMYITTLQNITEMRLAQAPDCWISQAMYESLEKESLSIRDAFCEAVHESESEDEE